MTPNTKRTALRTFYVLLAVGLVVAATYALTTPYDLKREKDAAAARAKIHPPPPGGEEALRRLIAGIESGQPDYAVMTKSLADETRKYLPQQKEMAIDFGSLQSLTYLGSRKPLFGGTPQQSYLVVFSNDATRWDIAPGPNGTIDEFWVGPYGPPSMQDTIGLYAVRPWRDQLQRLATQTAIVLIAAAIARYALRIRL